MGDIPMTDATKADMAKPVGEHKKLHRLRDSYREVEFEGILLGEVSTDNGSSPRWTEMELYKIADGSNRYVLSVVGRSLVYHAHESQCNSGVPVATSEITEDCEPCFKCNPPAPHALELSMTVDLEEDRPQVHVVADPKDLMKKLRSPHGQTISGPGQRLLAISAVYENGRVKDRGIYDAIHVVERL